LQILGAPNDFFPPKKISRRGPTLYTL